MGTPMSGICHR